MTTRLSTGLRNAMLGATGLGTTLAKGVIDIYSGAQPASADAAETGTKLMRITVGSAAFVSGVVTNGLSLGTPDAGAVAKAVEVWSGVGLVAGVAGWARFYANTVVTGVSTTSARMDMACATTGSQCNMSSTTIAVGATNTIDSFAVTLPAS